MQGSKITIPLAKPDENLSIGGQILLNVPKSWRDVRK
jgi:hypothetical protein